MSRLDMLSITCFRHWVRVVAHGLLFVGALAIFMSASASAASSVTLAWDSTTNNINAILSDENQAAFKHALADMATVAHTFAARKDALDAGITNAARTLENASRLSAQAGPVVDRVGHAADAVNTMGNEVGRTSASVGKTVNSIGTDLNRFTAETLPELERLLGELNTLSISLRRLTAQTERNPASLLFGRKPVPEGPGESSAPSGK